jgi:hypothetical protein
MVSKIQRVKSNSEDKYYPEDGKRGQGLKQVGIPSIRTTINLFPLQQLRDCFCA